MRSFVLRGKHHGQRRYSKLLHCFFVGFCGFGLVCFSLYFQAQIKIESVQNSFTTAGQPFTHWWVSSSPDARSSTQCPCLPTALSYCSEPLMLIIIFSTCSIRYLSHLAFSFRICLQGVVLNDYNSLYLYFTFRIKIKTYMVWGEETWWLAFLALIDEGMFIMLVAAAVGLSTGFPFSAILRERMPIVPSTIPRYFTAYEGPEYLVFITEKLGETFWLYQINKLQLLTIYQ